MGCGDGSESCLDCSSFLPSPPPPRVLPWLSLSLGSSTSQSNYHGKTWRCGGACSCQPFPWPCPITSPPHTSVQTTHLACLLFLLQLLLLPLPLLLLFNILLVAMLVVELTSFSLPSFFFYLLVALLLLLFSFLSWFISSDNCYHYL